MNKRALSFALSLLLITAFSACKKSDNAPIPPIKNKLVYIYKSDSADGVAFKNLLQVNGCSVTLLDKSWVSAFDFSSYNMIIIGGNTDVLLAPLDHWAPASDVTAVKNSGKPLLLLNQGGYLLGNELGTTVNWESSATNYLTAFNVVDPTISLYKQPKQITVPANNQLTIYTANSSVVSFYAATTPITNVLLIGQETGASYAKYYSLSFESNKYGFFGFYANANAMTATGKDFLVNFVYYVGGLTL